MDLINVEFEPYNESVYPGLRIDVEIKYLKYREAIITVTGCLKTDDGKKIADIHEEISTIRRPPREIGASGTVIKYEDALHKISLIGLIGTRALDYIEQRRRANEGDLDLTLDLNVKFAENRACISHIYAVDSKKFRLDLEEVSSQLGDRKTFDFLLYAYDREYGHNRSNLWLLSGDGSNTYMAISEVMLSKTKRIPQSDWVKDFLPKLRHGEYFIVEIPKGEKTIKEAWKHIEEAEDKLRKRDFHGVSGVCRDAGNILDKVIRNTFGDESFEYNERWGRAYLQFYSYLISLQLHLEDMTGHDWRPILKGLSPAVPNPKRNGDYPTESIRMIGYIDSEYILFASKALLKYAEELLKEKR